LKYTSDTLALRIHKQVTYATDTYARRSCYSRGGRKKFKEFLDIATEEYVSKCGVLANRDERRRRQSTECQKTGAKLIDSGAWSLVLHRCCTYVHYVFCFHNRSVKPNVNPRFSRVFLVLCTSPEDIEFHQMQEDGLRKWEQRLLLCHYAMGHVLHATLKGRLRRTRHGLPSGLRSCPERFNPVPIARRGTFPTASQVFGLPFRYRVLPTRRSKPVRSK